MQTSFLQQNKTTIIATMIAAGIKSATVNYAGGGDSGGVEEVNCQWEEGRQVDMGSILVTYAFRAAKWNGAKKEMEYTDTKSERAIEAALESIAYDAIEEAGHGGWENGEGGYGQLIINAAEGTMKLEHSDYIVDTNYSESTF